MTPTCSTCRFWQDLGSYSGPARGECRIKAPDLPAKIDGNGNPLTAGDPHWGVWPATYAKDFCGQFEVKA